MNKSSVVKLLDRYYCHDLYDLYDEMVEALILEPLTGLNIWHKVCKAGLLQDFKDSNTADEANATIQMVDRLKARYN